MWVLNSWNAGLNIRLIYLITSADLYALSRLIASSSKEQDNHKLLSQLDESEVTLAQLQHQLAPSEPGALMHLVEETEIEDDADEETKECRSLLKDMRFFLSREVVFFEYQTLELC